MSRYYINRAEPFSKGLKLELSQEGKQYPIKGVTLWNDHPRFNEFRAGIELDFELYEQDSANINPNTGKPYKDRSVSKFDTPQPNVPQMRQDTNLQVTLEAINHKLDKILDKIDPPKIHNTNIQYPQSETVTEEDSPF